jgi:hypothetical protein
LIDDGNNLLLSPLREGDGNKEDEQGDQGEEETSLTPLSPARGPQQKRKERKFGEKQNKKETSVILKKFVNFIFCGESIFKKYSVEDSSFKSPYCSSK